MPFFSLSTKSLHHTSVTDLYIPPPPGCQPAVTNCFFLTQHCFHNKKFCKQNVKSHWYVRTCGTITITITIPASTRCVGQTTRPTWIPASCSKKTAGSCSSSSSSSSSWLWLWLSLRARSIGGVSRRHYGRLASQDSLMRCCFNVSTLCF